MATVHPIRSNHPCFSPGARERVGRLHLPVAPRATSRVRFDTGPVRAQEALAPVQALALLDSVLAEGTELGMVGISGPGDPLAVPEALLQTLRLVRGKYPELPVCVTTNGLGAAQHAAALADLDLSHVTLLIDAVDPKVAEMIYAWIRPGTRNLRLPEAAELLVGEQAAAVEALSGQGVPVKVNTTVYRGCNEAHVADVARDVSELGAEIMAVVPFRAGIGGEDYLNVQPGMGIMREVREAAAKFIELMPPEEGCGEDLVGLVHPDPQAAALAAGGPRRAAPPLGPPRERGRGHCGRHGSGHPPGPGRALSGLRPPRGRAGVPPGHAHRAARRGRLRPLGGAGHVPVRLFRRTGGRCGRGPAQGPGRPRHRRAGDRGRGRGRGGRALRRRQEEGQGQGPLSPQDFPVEPGPE